MYRHKYACLQVTRSDVAVDQGRDCRSTTVGVVHPGSMGAHLWGSKRVWAGGRRWGEGWGAGDNCGERTGRGQGEAQHDISDTAEGGWGEVDSHPPAAAEPDHEKVMTLSKALNLPRWREGTLSIIKLFIRGRPQLAKAVRERWSATRTSLW